MIPELDDNDVPTGKFTAKWTGIWKVVDGTGRCRNARGRLEVKAINDLFELTDPVWTSDWSWSGRFRVPDDDDDDDDD